MTVEQTLLLALGVVFCLLGGLAFAVALYSKTWPSTQGRLITASVDSDTSSGQYTESPKVLYEFTVGNRTYRSSLIRPSGDLSWSTTVPELSSAQGQVDEIVNRGEPIVYYCPIFPRYACLRPGGFVAPVFLLVLGTGCLVARAWWS